VPVSAKKDLLRKITQILRKNYAENAQNQISKTLATSGLHPSIRTYKQDTKYHCHYIPV